MTKDAQGVNDLINAIATGDSLAIDSAFNSEMAIRISDRLEDMRVAVAQEMFTEGINGAVSSGKAQHSLVGSKEKKEHADYMNKTHAVTTKYHGGDEVSYHGSKANVKNAIVNHYNDEKEAKELHTHLFKEDFEQLDEVSGELLGRYIQKARADVKTRYQHSRDLDAHPKVAPLKAKLKDYYLSRSYTKSGESVHRKAIDKTHDKIEAIKKKIDPEYPKSANPQRRGYRVDRALDKLRSGKLTNEQVGHDDEPSGNTPNNVF